MCSVCEFCSYVDAVPCSQLSPPSKSTTIFCGAFAILAAKYCVCFEFRHNLGTNEFKKYI